jgi:hydrogenase maturation protein HypF
LSTNWSEETRLRRLHAEISGTVQGVGFRPFIFALAQRSGLAGWVANASSGVVLEVEGPDDAISAFFEALPRELPPHARIDSLATADRIPTGENEFTIRASIRKEGDVTLVLPDLATCPQCLAEMADPKDRRHLYPFINCTHCGPRFSIIEDLPYDRSRTGMRKFTLCADCAAEYADPRDRRFHAEPVACPACGPQLALWEGSGAVLATRDAALDGAVAALAAGKIVAVKGVGGFHLMVDALNEAGVMQLRQRKRRPHKAFAVMFPSLDDVEACCAVGPLERELLTSSAAPIVLLRRKDGATAPVAAVAPGSPLLGAMLPYTPLHHLLLRRLGRPFVATSGNQANEPIVTDEAEAPARLAGIADLFLVHDRPIVRPLDDSVARVVAGRVMLLRRARGYAPLPLDLPAGPTILAMGSYLKATITLCVGGHGFVSQHLGDIDTVQSRLAYRAATQDLPRLLASPPALLATELHPETAATQIAMAPPIPHVAVQHHAAHIAAVMAEHGLDGPVLGIAWDGSGWGTDGTVWGGEFLRVEAGKWERVCHFRPFPLPGGDAAAREPRRAALGLLCAIGEAPQGPFKGLSAAEAQALAAAVQRKLNAPLCTSVGRLFDAAASLLDLCQVNSHEGEAAMGLEFLAERGGAAAPYPFPLEHWIDWEPALRRLLAELRSGVPPADIAAGFHFGLVEAMVAAARRTGERDVVLAGGCFQNAMLLERGVRRLADEGFRVYWNQALPPNDGSISFGQAALLQINSHRGELG